MLLPYLGVVDSSIAGLRLRLERWPEDRFPIKNAGLRHGLGVALAREGDHVGAVIQMRQAIALYEGLPVERATVQNDLGAVLREIGDHAGARECFAEALAGLRSQGSNLAAGSAAFNLGLVLAETGSRSDAMAAFRQALAAFDPEKYPTEAGAILRELGAAMVVDGDSGDALDVLSRAVELAAVGGDRPGLAASANTLGLAYLAEGKTLEATAAFSESASANPESIRPEGFAMAKANLALAYEANGELDRARLVARQAAAVPMAPKVVIEQAQELLGRLGENADLHAILDSEPATEWVAVLRDEIQRWHRLPSLALSNESAKWLEGLRTRPGLAIERLAALFDVVLELPSDAMGRLLRALAQSARSNPDGGERFVILARRSSARFRIPQMQRLERELGVDEDGR